MNGWLASRQGSQGSLAFRTIWCRSKLWGLAFRSKHKRWRKFSTTATSPSWQRKEWITTESLKRSKMNAFSGLCAFECVAVAVSGFQKISRNMQICSWMQCAPRPEKSSWYDIPVRFRYFGLLVPSKGYPCWTLEFPWSIPLNFESSSRHQSIMCCLDAKSLRKVKLKSTIVLFVYMW